MGEGQHGATHAWTEIYIPDAGWQGFDPTNNKIVAASMFLGCRGARARTGFSALRLLAWARWTRSAKMEASVQVVPL
jgi:transglutaminase-like putative cysteine protease